MELATDEPGCGDAQAQAARALAMVNFANRVLPDPVWVDQFVQQLALGPAPVHKLLSRTAAEHHAAL
ncbi:MAG: hypothetical protein FJY26_12715 [Betaproteobacteria bacterium]|nr:hypothetical protein [Betaproteobacteria bacterium]